MFRFKQFAIEHDRCAQKVGTDGVLLGAWAAAEGSRALDIGAGTGLVAIMLAQRYPHWQIDAVEIDPECARQAAHNCQSSPWTDRLRVFAQPIQSFEPGYRYDLIAINPPYFEQGIQPPASPRQLARHTTSLTASEWIAAAARLLQPQGALAFIYPWNQWENLRRQLIAAGWKVVRQQAVKSREHKPRERVLAICKRKEEEENILPDLVIYEGEGNAWSREYWELTQAFYLERMPEERRG